MMIKPKLVTRIYDLLLLVLFTSLLFLSTHSFVEASTYSVSPPLIDLELEKRDIIYKEVTITNKDQRQLRIFPSVNEVSLDEDGGIQSFVPPSMQENKAAAVTSWIQVPRKRIEIPPGESRTVPVTFKVHPEVEPGEYHAIIGFGEGSNQPQAHAKVMEGTAPATIVSISVDKVQNQFLRLERFTVDRFVTGEGKGEITYELNNPGSDRVVPGGEIIIYDNNGNEVSSVDVNPEGVTLNGGETKTFTAPAPFDLSVGKYKAFLSVEYGEHLTASIHDTAFFYILPLEQLVAFFLATMVVAIVIALYVHRRYDSIDEYNDGLVTEVPLYLRADRSESKEHDIDLTKKE